MRIRSGFVSNSSSSSYLIAFPKKIESDSDMAKLLGISKSRYLEIANRWMYNEAIEKVTVPEDTFWECSREELRKFLKENQEAFIYKITWERNDQDTFDIHFGEFPKIFVESG